MSLTSFIKVKEVRAKCRGIRPNFPRKVPVPIRVPPRTKNYSTIGTAFDYLLRFEIQRRVPWANGDRWVAENAFLGLALCDKGDRIFLRMKFGGDPDETILRLQALAQRVISSARADFLAYCTLPNPNPRQIERMAKHCIGLARLDVIFRAGVGSVGRDIFNSPTPDDIQDLVDLLEIFPFDSLAQSSPLLLNPTFGDSSLLVGGADADLLVGQSLWDIKTTIKPTFEAGMLDQLLGYMLLARNERRTVDTFPQLNQFCIYFARHGYLWPVSAELWTAHPDFDATESWFFEAAADIQAKQIM